MSGPDMEIITINDHLAGFYAGRDNCDQKIGAAALAGLAPAPADWVQFDLSLGVCAYAFHRDERALVFDTLVSPEHGRAMRVYLERELGIRHSSVALSHWHLDHVAGNGAFKDCDILASDQTLRILTDNRARIEAGDFWGPPPLKPLVLPNLTGSGPMPYALGDLALELMPFNIHTPGSLALYSAQDKILLAGDMLEDNIPCLNHPEAAHTYLAGLEALAGLDIAAIYPGHGSPHKIKGGGYDKRLIAATAEYIRYVLALCREESDRGAMLKDWLAPWEAQGVLVYHPVYEGVHRANLERLRGYYQDRPMPEIVLDFLD